MHGIVGGQQHFSGRGHYTVELCADYILKQYGPGPFVSLDIGVEWKVEGHYLNAGIGLARVIQSIARKKIGTGSGLKSLVSSNARPVVLLRY